MKQIRDREHDSNEFADWPFVIAIAGFVTTVCIFWG